MIGYLWRLLIGSFHQCKHTWEMKEKISVVNADGQMLYPKYILQCTKCGELTKREL